MRELPGKKDREKKEKKNWAFGVLKFSTVVPSIRTSEVLLHLHKGKLLALASTHHLVSEWLHKINRCRCVRGKVQYISWEVQIFISKGTLSINVKKVITYII